MSFEDFRGRLANRVIRSDGTQITGRITAERPAPQRNGIHLHTEAILDAARAKRKPISPFRRLLRSLF